MVTFLYLLFFVAAIVGFHKWQDAVPGPLIMVLFLFLAANFVFSLVISNILHEDGMYPIYITMVFLFWVTLTVLFNGLSKGIFYIIVNLAQVAGFIMVLLHIIGKASFKIGG